MMDMAGPLMLLVSRVQLPVPCRVRIYIIICQLVKSFHEYCKDNVRRFAEEICHIRSRAAR